MKPVQMFLAAVVLLAATASFGQQSYMDEPGIPAFTTAFPVEHGFINLANGNLHVEIPIATYPQRGNRKVLHYRLVYDSRFWIVRTDPVSGALTWVPNGISPIGVSIGAGFRLISDGEAGNTNFSQDTQVCGYTVDAGGKQHPQYRTTYSGYVYEEPDGSMHRTPGGFKLYLSSPYCTNGGQVPTGTTYATDNSGYKFVINNGTVAVFAADGTLVKAAPTGSQGILPGEPMVQDTNGNLYSYVHGQYVTFNNVVDTLGRMPVVTTFTDSSFTQAFIDYLCETGCNPANGDRARIVVTIAPSTWSTHFNAFEGGTAVGEYNGGGATLQSIVFPDGSTYQFQQDSYGMITSMTLPTGGQISYGYTNFLDLQGNVNRWVASRTVDGNTWTFAPTIPSCSAQPCNQQVTVTTPPYNDGTTTASDTHVYTFVVGNGWYNGGAWNTQTQYFRGPASGTPLLTKTTDYSGTGVDTCPVPNGGASPLPVRETLTWPMGSGALSKKAEYCYDVYGNKTTIKEWDYQPNGNFPAAPDRETDTTYKTDPAYVGPNIINLPLVSTSFGPGHTQTAQTTYGYDETGLQPSGVTTNLATPTAPRANLTSTSKWLNTSTTPVISSATWYDSGEVYQSKDPMLHTATTYFDSTGAYPNQVCNALNQCAYPLHDFNTGLMTSFTDMNGSQAGDPAHTTTYTYDTLLRPLCTNLPDGGQTCLSYPDPNHVSRQQKITSALSDVSTTVFDGLGRVSRSQHTLPACISIVDTGYDPVGAPFTVSNPYCTTADPTYGITQSFHDALGRGVKTIRQDGSAGSAAYSVRNSATVKGTCVTATDEAGNKRTTCHNGFGELREVDEPGASFPGAQASGNIDIGPIKTTQVGGHPAYQASGSVTISGSEGSQTTSAPYCAVYNTNGDCVDWEFNTFTVYDSGSVKITVNGHTDQTTYGQGDDVGAIANRLAGVIRANSPYVDYTSVSVNLGAVPPTATINLISRTAGSATNYPLSATYTFDTADFTAGSFTTGASGSALTGGADAVSGTPVTDHGAVTMSAGSFTTPAISYGPGTANLSAASVAAALASALSVPGSGVTATTNGATGITVTAAAFAASGNGVSAATHPVSSDPTDFPSPSFSVGSILLSGGADPDPSGLTLPFVTLYNYDPLGNLYCVEQHGSASTGTGCPATPPGPTDAPVQPDPDNAWRRRFFAYDSLSRLRWASNPESGIITYAYDADGELLQKTSPAPNQTGSATQTVSYCYDPLHRVTGKGYGAQSCPMATPVVSYAYDSGDNAKGHLVSLTDQAGTASYTYDILGRLATETRTLTGANNGAISKAVSYEYNLDGSLYKLHYPSGAVVTYTPDSAGRTLSAVDSGSGINYVTGATYGPDSALTGFVSGNSGTFAGITNSFAYNKRLQPLTMSATAPSQTVFSIGYDFHAGNGTANSGSDNGNVYGITNYKDQNRNQTFTYDGLNRLISAQNVGTNCATMVLQNKTEYWGNSYGYDAWGNLLQKNITKCGAENLSVTADAHNWLHASGTDYQYDAAGNMTYDATAALNYTYDEENRLTGAAGYTYTYDGDGNRVRKSNGNLAANGTLYWYMTPGVVAETDLAGTTKSEYIFFDGERVARRDGATGTGGVFYYFSDHLKTASVITDSAGVIKAESDYYPWGGELQFVNNDSNDYKFTGKKRDTETGLDYFGARYYSNGLGRWVSADWSATPVPVPYANFYDPQTLNLYQFVGGNPASKADPDGHEGPGSYEGMVAMANSIGDRVAEDLNTIKNAFGPSLPHAENPGLEVMKQRLQQCPCPSNQKQEDSKQNNNNSKSTDQNESGGQSSPKQNAGTPEGTGRAPSKIDRAQFKAEREAFWKAEAKNHPEKYSAKDLAKMEKGRAPTGADGHPVELHHVDRTPTGPKEPLTRTDHRLGDNYKKNHPD